NFYPLVYIHSFDFIDSISLYPSSPKPLTKVYIQNVTNKEVKTSMGKKEKARSMLAFYINLVISRK
ncbi:hypothetical protein CN947_24750, partial [Bacillus cereus]